MLCKTLVLRDSASQLLKEPTTQPMLLAVTATAEKSAVTIELCMEKGAKGAFAVIHHTSAQDHPLNTQETEAHEIVKLSRLKVRPKIHPIEDVEPAVRLPLKETFSRTIDEGKASHTIPQAYAHVFSIVTSP